MRGLGRWTPAVIAALVLLLVAGAGAVGGGSNDAAPTTVDELPVDTVDPAFAVPVSTEPQVVTVPTTQPVQKQPLGRTLAKGLAGNDVKMVQERLHELGFDPGVVDGIYGDLTIQAVWAFEKLVMGTERSKVTGRVTPEIWDRMQDNLVIQPRRPQAATKNHTEIYLPEQVMIVFHDDTPALITHISSGDNKEWCEEVTISPGEQGNERGTEEIKKGVCGKSVTPGGVFRFYRRVEGRRESQLGGMYNPVYFNYGIAVHGALQVPNYPASHGCIRIPMHISDYFQELVRWGRNSGDMVYVWDGVKEPERYGAQLPVFNWNDPTYTTTTSSTTTIPTTTVPQTTVPSTAPGTTHSPATTVAPTTAPPTTTVPATTVPPSTNPPS
jgi:hypothetical protein